MWPSRSSILALSYDVLRGTVLRWTPNTLSNFRGCEIGVLNGWFFCTSGVVFGTLFFVGCATFLLLGGGMDLVVETRVHLLNSCSGGFDENSSKPETSSGCTSSWLATDVAGRFGGTWLLFGKSSDSSSSWVGCTLEQSFYRNKN